MADAYIQLPNDGAGKKVQAWDNTVSGETVHTQASTPTDSSGTEIIPATAAQITTANTTLSSIDSSLAGTLTVDGSGSTQPVSGSVTANAGTNLNTSALALETGGNLAASAASLSVMDDWDESDRAKVNPIAGQAGVQGASGIVTNNTQRVTLATDVALPTGTNSIGQVTANAGTNLNTSALALESGGNLAAIKAKTDNIPASPATTAKQDTGNTSLASIDGKITAVNTGAVVVSSSALPTGAALEAGNLATLAGAVKTEDAASANADPGIVVLGMRQDTPANTSNNDGDYEPLRVSAGRAWVSAKVDTALPAGSNAIGKLAANDGVDVGDVTINNASGASAVNIQDGGNSITVDGTITASNAAGDVANDGIDSGNPVKVGGQARITNPTAVADADRSNFITDKLGKQVVVGCIRDLKGQQKTTITTSVAETTIATQVASTFLDIYRIICTNTSTSPCNVTIKDSTAGTTREILAVPAGQTVGWSVPESGALNQATVNNNWTATCSASITSMEITVQFVKNI